MTLAELIVMTRLYARDQNSFMFSDDIIKTFLNQAIDRIKQYAVFLDMPYLNRSSDVVKFIPRHYHYILALFASSRCYDMDERFYEGTEKRNEFEFYFENLISDIEGGNVIILDGDGNEVENTTGVTDYVVDVYFNPERGKLYE